ncbi:CcdB family protein [Mycobacterium sp. KBS0706]|uniref:CcdB family protein n=1 Tax=Mycobacterium sp. KBS0706 TaxID=2578109 RepID=UPI00163DC07A|nr:CcdB family protein [Mycobacterium sp. KBS0706]
MRFDVHRVSRLGGRLVLNVQSEFHDHLATRVVVPLIPLSAYQGGQQERLEPILSIDGQRYFLQTTHVGAVRASELGSPIASLADQHSAIVDALDFLFQGF